MMETDHDVLGRVLKAHLVVETFLTEFLEEQLGADEVAAANLSFYKMASLIPNAGSPASFVKPGILALNTIRNRFAHDPSASIEARHLAPISEALKVMRPGMQDAAPVLLVEEFAKAATAFLLVSPPQVRRALEEALAHFHIAANGGEEAHDGLSGNPDG